MAEFTDLDDVSVNHCFKLWTRSSDEVLARLCRGLLFRGLYKTIDLSHVTDAEVARLLVAKAQAAVNAAGGEVSYDLFYDDSTLDNDRIASNRSAILRSVIEALEPHKLVLARASDQPPAPLPF